jgi:hypothetical protein
MSKAAATALCAASILPRIQSGPRILPDFVADETALRYGKIEGETPRQLTDKIEAEIVVQGKGAVSRATYG